MNDLITVVIPIYNVEKYLRKCIDSVIDQSYKNIEIILVDDGSPDNCGKICDEYKVKDQRIKVIHKPNGGLSDARNAGINIAKGKYITFIDSDDYILEDCIQTLYNNIKKSNKDISIGQIQILKNENSLHSKQVTHEETRCYDTSVSLEKLLYNTEYTSNMAGKLFKTVLFEKIKFPFGKKYEDLATVYKIIANSNGVVVTNKFVYRYLSTREGSIMNEKFSETRMDSVYFAEEILKFIKDNYNNIINSANARLLIECRDVLVEIPETR